VWRATDRLKIMDVNEIKKILAEKIPENLIVAQHNEVGHFYRHVPTGGVFPSVTTKGSILDAPHLKKWSARLAVEHFAANLHKRKDIEMLKKEAVLVHQDQFEEAGDVGTRGHGVVDEYLKEWIIKEVPRSDIRTVITDLVNTTVDGEKYNDPRVFAAARSAEMFCRDFHVIPVASEMKVCSLKHKFAGTLDSLMMVLNIETYGDGKCEDVNDVSEGKRRIHDFLSLSKSNPNKVKCLHCGLKGEYELAIVDWKTSNSIDKVEYAMQTSAYWQALFEMTGLRPKKIYIVRLDKKQAKYEVRVLTNRVAAFKAFKYTTRVYDWLNDGQEKLVSATPKEKVSLDDLELNPI